MTNIFSINVFDKQNNVQLFTWQARILYPIQHLTYINEIYVLEIQQLQCERNAMLLSVNFLIFQLERFCNNMHLLYLRCQQEYFDTSVTCIKLHSKSKMVSLLLVMILKYLNTVNLYIQQNVPEFCLTIVVSD